MSEDDPAAGGKIWVLALADDTEADEDEDRGAVLDRLTARYQRTKLPSKQLRENLGGFLDSMEEVVGRIPQALGSFSVDKVELSAEISAKGTVSLVGTGGELGATGGITITLVRRPG
ncbi:MAG: hypothetical protein M3540_06685 [Actinomycetota bacterium]|nr:hypothetical protein [Actinomycetota bacterium]